MAFSHDQSTIFYDSRDLSLGIIYPVICIICAFFLVRRIRHRQRTRYTLSEGQMKTQSEKSGGKQTSGATNEGFAHPMDATHYRAHLPSACDILRPLSHSSSLPPSGYLAAVLTQERRNPRQYQHDNEHVRPTSSSGTNSLESASVAWRTDLNQPSGIESSPTQTDDSSQATSPLISPSADGFDRELPSSPDSGEAQSVQKRSQQVQFLRDVDEEGVRTWRRAPLRKMTLTTYPATTDPSDLAALNVSRLIARLEHNVLSPNADLKSLRRSEDHRLRVGANIEYARASLQALERSLPQIKPADRRHELQSTLSRNRQTLKQLQNVLDEIQAEEEVRSSSRGSAWGFEEDDEDAEDLWSEDVLGTPEGASTTDEVVPGDDAKGTLDATAPSATATATVANVNTVEASSSRTPTAPAPTAPTPALRNRHHNTPSLTSTSKAATATATGTSRHHPSEPTPNHSQGTGAETEEALSTDRAEQETLTSSLLNLATQLKTSSQQFQASLEAEKSVLARAAEGLDRTTGNLAAAEKRMGLLRRMTEGKGWWGRMMLYAWIFALTFLNSNFDITIIRPMTDHGHDT
ncbi:uncharacterized protein BDV17DRAFT_278472 [Aspergillus undulatus]|uniref:uncharacterized protein n=1 Tax=Aspergillus undulatus TaxID=1810928 RepID=UPI003CCD42AB